MTRYGVQTAVLASFLLLLCASAALAQDRVTLGWGRLFSNDFIGDGEDRWRSGSYVVSLVRGPVWQGALPGFGQLIELRLRSEIISAASVRRPAAGDRRYAGVLGFGIFSHFALAEVEASLGAELVVTGAQSGVSGFQTLAHRLLGAPKPGGLDQQISNLFTPAFALELGQSLQISNNLRLRPFVEARVGDETLLRFGADLFLGQIGRDGLMLRDPVTGQRYLAVAAKGVPAGGMVLGGDLAAVDRSIYLPAPGPVRLYRHRARLRAGWYWQGRRAELFYGLTWLGREFIGQPEGQVTGSLNLRWHF